MKYQDLCITLKQIAQNYGVNSVFFEDINLLNSEDVIYPALVCQLKNVELYDGYDRYTLVMTWAKRVQNPLKIETNGEITNTLILDNPSAWEEGRYAYNTGMPSSATATMCRWNGSVFIKGGSRIKFDNTNEAAYGIYVLYATMGWNAMIDNTAHWLNGREITITQDCYVRICYNYATIADISDLRTQITIITPNSQNEVIQPHISYTIIHAIRAALGNMNSVQIESCNVQPFKYKFRDECEGVVAEIILDVYFDSRCN